jgi:hypothetical protein
VRTIAVALYAALTAASMTGTWKMDPAKSFFPGSNPPKSLTMRIELHPKGRVMTVDRIEADDRATSSSTILYLDGLPRHFRDFECAGSQSSRQLDAQTVQIRSLCESGERIWVIRALAGKSSELMIEVTVNTRGGSTSEGRVVLRRKQEER